MTDRPRHIDSRHRWRNAYEQGFTLIELLVVITIIPLVVGAISVALISVITQQTATTNKLSDSQDTQVVSQNFVQDVQSAFSLTTNADPASPSKCGAQTQTPILSMFWPNGNNTVVVSYNVLPVGNSHDLYRELCTNGGSTTPTNTRIVAYDVQSGLLPTISGQSCPPTSLSCKLSAQSASVSGWTSAAGVTGVQLSVAPQAAGDKQYQYALSGVPRVSTAASRGFNQPPGHPTAISLGSSGDDVTCNGNNNNGGGLTVDGTLQIDSTSQTVASTMGSITISAAQIDTGSTNLSSLSGNVTPQPPSQTGVTVSDPFAGITPPVTGLLTATLTPGTPYEGYNVYAGGTYANPQPGIYTGPIAFPNGIIPLNGVYILMQGVLVPNGSNPGGLAGQTTLVSGANGTLIYIYQGSFNVSGLAALNLSPFSSSSSPYQGAPSPWPGIVIWQDGPGTQGAADTGDNTALGLAGNSTASIVNGTVYAPSASAGPTGNANLTVGSMVTSGIACGGNGMFTIG